jgi:hypothetical protein
MGLVGCFLCQCFFWDVWRVGESGYVRWGVVTVEVHVHVSLYAVLIVPEFFFQAFFPLSLVFVVVVVLVLPAFLFQLFLNMSRTCESVSITAWLVLRYCFGVFFCLVTVVDGTDRMVDVDVDGDVDDVVDVDGDGKGSSNWSLNLSDGMANLLSGHIPDFLNPAITLDGLTDRNHICIREVSKQTSA